MILATKIVTNLYCFLLFSLLLQQFFYIRVTKGFQGISDTFLSVAFNFSHAIVFRSGYMKVCDIRTPNFEILELDKVSTFSYGLILVVMTKLLPA